MVMRKALMRVPAISALARNAGVSHSTAVDSSELAIVTGGRRYGVFTSEDPTLGSCPGPAKAATTGRTTDGCLPEGGQNP